MKIATETKRITSLAGTMKAWMIDQYNGPLVQREVPIPQITASNQVLLKVKAASVNPIDARMTTGYGDELLGRWRQCETFSLTKPRRLPLIAGRDCCGEVVAVGSGVRNVAVGEQVIAVVPGPWQGSHAEYVLTKQNAVARKPMIANYVEATTLPYVACTAWAALVSTAQVNPKNAHGLRVLIHGGSGGMGSAAIQMLKCWGADKVVATCSAKK